MVRTPYLKCYQRLGVPPPDERPLWERRRGLGLPIGVKEISKVPLARRRRRWVSSGVHRYEQLEQVGEGTYGQVWSARDKMTNEIVALKKFRMDNEREGFPITAIREIKLLKTLKHENIVCLKEIVTGAEDPTFDKDGKKKGGGNSIYMVFEFMLYDLVKLLDSRKITFTVSQAKNMSRQILRGLAYCHGKGVLHRDIKGSNVLLDERGSVKLADFGLARKFGEAGRKYTNRVVTLWYRSPELLLGATQYGAGVDMWSAGCLIAELLSGKPLFAGRDEAEQMSKIWRMVGSPNDEVWPDWRSLPLANMTRVGDYRSSLSHYLKQIPEVTDACVDLVSSLLSLDPEKRPTAEEALDHEWFVEQPYPCANYELKWRDQPGPRDRKDGSQRN